MKVSSDAHVQWMRYRTGNPYWPDINYDLEYYPCHEGLHVCGQTPDGERPATVANVPDLTRDAFERLRSEFALPEGEDFDLIVDFFENGHDITTDFCIRRQTLDAMLRAALKEAEGRDG